MYTYTHTHIDTYTHTHIDIYIYVCACILKNVHCICIHNRTENFLNTPLKPRRMHQHQSGSTDDVIVEAVGDVIIKGLMTS